MKVVCALRQTIHNNTNMSDAFVVRSSHEKNSGDVFRKLWKDKIFTDVTLQCDDGQVIKVHRVILSSYSSLFFNVLKNHKEENSVIMLSEISYVYLHLVLQFTYLGECKVKVDQMEKIC